MSRRRHSGTPTSPQPESEVSPDPSDGGTGTEGCPGHVGGSNVRELGRVVQVHRTTHDELLQEVQHASVTEELKGKPVVLELLGQPPPPSLPHRTISSLRKGRGRGRETIGEQVVVPWRTNRWYLSETTQRVGGDGGSSSLSLLYLSPISWSAPPPTPSPTVPYSSVL